MLKMPGVGCMCLTRKLTPCTAPSPAVRTFRRCAAPSTGHVAALPPAACCVRLATSESLRVANCDHLSQVRASLFAGVRFRLLQALAFCRRSSFAGARLAQGLDRLPSK